MSLVNHLKNKEAQRKFLTLSFGLQAANGTPTHSSVSGAAPSHQITAFNALGVGEWNRCLGAFFKGEEIPASDYNFHTGAKATGMTTGDQQVDSFFEKDVPHSGTACIGYKAPVGLGNPDNAANPPVDFKGIFETKKCLDFNSSGIQTNFSYSANPARCIVETIFNYGRLLNIPPNVWANYVAYWKSRIDWGCWAEFRDFHAQTETVDYRTLPDFEGFGLTAKYYSGAVFNQLVQKFVHPNFDISYSLQPPTFGISGDFSAEFTGYIKFLYSETYTIYITHNDGARLWINSVQKIDAWRDDAVGPVGTDSGTHNATANAFAEIKMHWNDKGGGNFKVEWESASQPREVIPSKYLYPQVEQQELYESHIFIDSPLSIAATIREILFVSNSIMQDVNGKLRFFCYEQLTPSFTLDNSNIDKFSFRPRDILRRDPFTQYEASFKDLDSQYLQEPAKTVWVDLDVYARRTFENVKVIPLYNNTRWRVKKIIDTRVKLDVENGLLADVETAMAKTYPITAGDLITATHRKIGASPRNFLVLKTADGGVGESTDVQSNAIEKRKLVLQEWN